jgi:hypothetical protein
MDKHERTTKVFAASGLDNETLAFANIGIGSGSTFNFSFSLQLRLLKKYSAQLQPNVFLKTSIPPSLFVVHHAIEHFNNRPNQN